MNSTANTQTAHTPSGIVTTVFNLIIVDESGSMSHLTDQTISGCNETLNVVRQAAKEQSATSRSLVSIYAFQNGGPVTSRYLVKNAKAAEVRDITRDDYRPYGNTPLLDAVGSTLSELKAVAATHEDATGIITIITDGYENSSVSYDWGKVAALISQFKEMGWTVNLIGANIDVEAMASRINVDNHYAFQATKTGTSAMFSTFADANRCRYNDMAEENAIPDANVRKEARRKKSKGFFSGLK